MLNFSTGCTPSVCLPGREEDSHTDGVASLGNNTSIASTIENLPWTIEKYILQNKIRGILGDSARVYTCMRHRLNKAAVVPVMYSERYKNSFFSNLMICGSVWTCPVCGSKISHRRAQEIKLALSGWPGGLFMTTFTMQHNKNDRLVGLLDLLSEAYRSVKSGREFQEMKSSFGIIGSITATEIKYGSAGWHPHKHTLWLCDKKIQEKELIEINKIIEKSYLSSLYDLGGSALSGIAVKSNHVETGASEYISKWDISSELTQENKKNGGGMSPFDLVSADSREMNNLFCEYVHATKRKNKLVWSRGLKNFLRVNEKSDMQIASEEQADTASYILALISAEGWRTVLRKEIRGQILNIANGGDAEILYKYLKEQGIDLQE